jgi:hypothetical protein
MFKRDRPYYFDRFVVVRLDQVVAAATKRRREPSQRRLREAGQKWQRRTAAGAQEAVRQTQGRLSRRPPHLIVKVDQVEIFKNFFVFITTAPTNKLGCLSAASLSSEPSLMFVRPVSGAR